MAQGVQRGQVVPSMRVDRLQPHFAHEGRVLLAADEVELGLKDAIGGGDHLLDDLVVGDAVALRTRSEASLLSIEEGLVMTDVPPLGSARAT